MKKFKTTIAVLGACLSLSACTTTVSKSKSLNTYLQQFISQPASAIQQHLDLKAMGYQVDTPPTLSQNELTYTVLRPITIPTPMVSNVNVGANTVPLQIGNNSANSYDINFNCKIIFHLEHQIAQSVRYEGRAC